MEIRGIAKGDKELRHFTFDDEDYVVRGGVYYYKVNYGKNPLEGEYGEDEVSYVECSKVIPLGGKKPRPIPGTQKSEPVSTPVEEVQEAKKRGRKPNKTTKVDKLISSPDIIPVSTKGNIEKFEYTVHQFNYNNPSELRDALNKMGDEGWEMCGFSPFKSLFGDTHIVAVFKRKRG